MNSSRPSPLATEPTGSTVRTDVTRMVEQLVAEGFVVDG